MIVYPSTLPPMSIPDAQRAEFCGAPWRVRLVFVGANPQNASGRSDKWWEAANGPGTTPYMRWGATGARGQSKAADPGRALASARAKVAKGYVYDSTVRVAAKPLSSLQALVNAATWREMAGDQVLMLAGEHGFVALDLGFPVSIPNGSAVGLSVQTFLAVDGAIWGLAPMTLGLHYYSRLRA